VRFPGYDVSLRLLEREHGVLSYFLGYQLCTPSFDDHGCISLEIRRYWGHSRQMTGGGQVPLVIF